MASDLPRAYLCEECGREKCGMPLRPRWPVLCCTCARKEGLLRDGALLERVNGEAVVDAQWA